MVVGDASLDIDLLVIGAGPGGYVAAIRAAQLGQSVLIVDKDALGRRVFEPRLYPIQSFDLCSSSRMSMRSMRTASGISVENVKVDFAKVQAWKNSIVAKQTGGVSALAQRQQDPNVPRRSDVHQ